MHEAAQQSRVAIITGAGSGIGAATARRLAAEGAALLLVDINDGGLASTRASLGAETADRCHIQVSDVAAEDSAPAAVRTCLDAFGRVDVLVNAAGIAPVGNVEETSLALWKQTFAANVEAIFLFCRAAIPALRASGGGAIVNLASEAGLVGFERYAAYCASKSAVIGLTRSLALDHAGDGIRVNCVCPGSIDTPLLRRWYDDQEDPDQARADDLVTHPLGVGQPEDVAAAIAFLAGEGSHYTTGHALAVDGGYTCR